MKLPTKKNKSLAFNMTPLIDITFLLIVFFVMSNQLIRDETAMEAILPREASGELPPEDDSNKIVINVPNAKEIYFGAKRVTLDELRERLTREKIRAKRDTSIRIRANRDVPYGAIEPILVLCVETGFPDASFAVINE